MADVIRFLGAFGAKACEARASWASLLTSLQWELGEGQHTQRCAALRPLGVGNWHEIVPQAVVGLVYRLRDCSMVGCGDLWSRQVGRRGQSNDCAHDGRNTHGRSAHRALEVANGLRAAANAPYHEGILSRGRRPLALALRRRKFLAKFGQNSLAELTAWAQGMGLEVILI